MTFGLTSVGFDIEIRIIYLTDPDVYSTEGCIGNPRWSVAVEMLYTDSTDATAIQMLSYASHRPGHVLKTSISAKCKIYGPK